jgi:Hsp70 protein
MPNHRSRSVARAQDARRHARRTRQRVAAAIDFGTYGSGFAWAFISENEKPIAQRTITFHQDWPEQVAPYVKTRTALLLSGDGRVLEWGNPASLRYRREARTHPGLLLASNFKMSLPRDDHDALVLAAAYLERLYRYALALITEQAQVREDEIRWCVTVPAIWRDRERNLTRQAAVAAGLPDDPVRLLIAVEPEVATQHCRGYLQQIESSEEAGEDCDILVVDAGGGTVDLTSFHIDQNGKMTEIGRPSGEALGGTAVDAAFIRIVLAQRLTVGLLEELEAELPGAVLEILADWERDKRNFRPDRGAPFNLRLPVALLRLLDKRGLLDGFAERQGGVDDMFVLTNDEVQAAFDSAVDPILALVDEHLRHVAAPITHTFLVGGFAQSPYLRVRLERHLAGRTTVVVPPSPASAVLAGAVHFALDPGLVIARRSPRVYGIATNLPFDDELDPPDRIYVSSNGQRLCPDRF